jgi:hypothetical protein
MVLGNRHFGLKAMPHGGAGQADYAGALRHVSSGTDGSPRRGESAVTNPLNDPYAFRIAALAWRDRTCTVTVARTTDDQTDGPSGLPPLARRETATMRLQPSEHDGALPGVEAVLTARPAERPARSVSLFPPVRRDVTFDLRSGVSRSLQY